MSRTHLSANTLLLWFSLSAAAACLASVGCSSSDDSGTPAAAGKGGSAHAGGATGKAGSESGSEAGDSSVGGMPDEPDDTGKGGKAETASGGRSNSTGGTASTSGGSTSSGGYIDDGAGGEPSEGGAGGAPDAVDPEVLAAQERTLTVIKGLENVRKCTTCHQKDYDGAGFFANITPDVETGIGSWSEEQIKAAIRDGKDKDGKDLCATMERYTFTEAQLSDFAIYLKHLPPIKKKISAKCPSP